MLVPLEAGLAVATQLNPASELAAQLAVSYLVLWAKIATARALLAAMDDEER